MATKAFDMRIVEPSCEVKGMFILAKPRCFFLKLCAEDEDKACNQNQIRSKEKEFYRISF